MRASSGGARSAHRHKSTRAWRPPPHSSADGARKLANRTAGRGPTARGSGVLMQPQMRVRRPAGRRRGVVRAQKLFIVSWLRRSQKLRRYFVEQGRLGLDLVAVVGGPANVGAARLFVTFCKRNTHARHGRWIACALMRSYSSRPRPPTRPHDNISMLHGVADLGAPCGSSSSWMIKAASDVPAIERPVEGRSGAEEAPGRALLEQLLGLHGPGEGRLLRRCRRPCCPNLRRRGDYAKFRSFRRGSFDVDPSSMTYE